jgi:hypothetical protein
MEVMTLEKICRSAGSSPGAAALFSSFCVPRRSRIPIHQRMGDDAAMRVLLPVGRSAHAIVAGYLGLFAVLVFPAPLALLFGILAARDIRRSRSDPHPKHGMGRAVFGIIMGALGTAVPVIGLVSVLSGG